ncbi:MAG: chemotaxis protein CheW [Silvanigrellales bacterium]|jgi:purine-binding chemotaxis protein CheW|nr:chemotaxis protein CheW [Silvanigrellales bacterium]
MSFGKNASGHSSKEGEGSRAAPEQYSSFRVQGKRYCVNALSVQEIVRAMPITPLPLAPAHIHGLLNLRGQIVTAIGVRELFSLAQEPVTDKMNVVCNLQGTGVSLLVDEIDDVVEFPADALEAVPDSVSPRIRSFLGGVFKTPGEIFCVIDLVKVMDFLNSDKAQIA